MKQCTMTEWIQKRCNEIKEEGDWSVIRNFLRYQEISLMQFLCALRPWLESQPKKNCIVIHGPPDCGKSFFAYSLLSFFKGKVANFYNSRSQFWLMPFVDVKMGLLDDATYSCWDYIDKYMRSALDGSTVSVDFKHRAPLQCKLPPLVVTSNINVMSEEKYKYLWSRLQCLHFPRKMPLDARKQPIYSLTNGCWKSFFKRLHKQLGLTGLEEEETEHGES